MIRFLDIDKQNITQIKDTIVLMNAHFLTDTSQSWIFSNPRTQEGICEVHIHYISPENNKRMLMEQPLWKGYINSEIPDEEARKQLFNHIDQGIIHVILNVHQSYKYMTKELVSIVYGILSKNHPEVEEIQIDTFIYTEIVEFEGNSN